LKDRAANEWTQVALVYVVGLVGALVVLASVIAAPFLGFAQNTNCTNYYNCDDSGCSECRLVVVAGIGHPLVQAALAVSATVALARRLPRFIPAVVLAAWVIAALLVALAYWWWLGNWP
jgi:hypothetical protein